MAARSIPYPEGHSEFEVQAWLYMQLRNSGRDVRGEVKTLYEPKCNRTRKKAQFCRFDLVEYREGVAVHVYEVKANPVKHRAGIEGTRQGQRYNQFGVPVTFVYGQDGAEAIARAAN
jgi:hypothetical protein